MIHSGNLSYLNSVHRKYGVWKYNMFMLKQWSNGKMTVEFREKTRMQEIWPAPSLPRLRERSDGK